ncbi:flagellar FlbD family protein [Desulfuribacillus alkaliarsenatis]|uniref:Flagellar protein FlbD n=1 Tax=Desulfuribacillus alkaliarsenatis TaxID=766136 RepID=A0A1E5G793_9FIRM|nr:flagellar FlbD family protein [Desulfuribacillus alkaliarsenatis]OEF98614.1 hypothetical protein BHF68_02820 [Desulfuribacillus alkaliarsenatis]
MIEVSRLNGSTFYINPLHIEGFESIPDVVITLTNGKKLVVRENADEIITKLTEFYRNTGGLKVVIQYQAQQEIEK